MTGHWSYCDEDGCGPQTWPSGVRQSPINISTKEVHTRETVDHIQFINYHHVIDAEIVNNGHSVQVLPNCRAEIYGGGLDQVYRLVQYHFHWGAHTQEGSEHLVNGVSYAAELHLVHQGIEDPTKLAVIGILLEENEQLEGKALEAEEIFLTDIQNNKSSRKIRHLNLSDKLPKNIHSFFRYEGSLTTPPCSEIVTWTVFTEPLPITPNQLALLRGLRDASDRELIRNFRPTQEVNGRTVTHYVAN